MLKGVAQKTSASSTGLQASVPEPEPKASTHSGAEHELEEAHHNMYDAHHEQDAYREHGAGGVHSEEILPHIDELGATVGRIG